MNNNNNRALIDGVDTVYLTELRLTFFCYVFQNGVFVAVKITVINSFKMSSDELESWRSERWRRDRVEE